MTSFKSKCQFVKTNEKDSHAQHDLTEENLIIIFPPHSCYLKQFQVVNENQLLIPAL